MATRVLTSEQLANATATSTRPVTLIAWEYSGALEYQSCSGNITFDGNNYIEGSCTVSGLKNSESAIITMPSDPVKLGQLVAFTWYRGACQIWVIPAVPYDGGVYTIDQGVLMLDGYLTRPKYANGKIVTEARHKNYDGNFTPRYMIDEVCSVMPPAGTVLAMASERVVLERRKK